MLFLSEIPVIKSMNFSTSELENILAVTKQRHYGKKEILLSPHQEETTFRFVRKGIVRMYFIHKNNRQVNVQFAVENDIICCYASYMSGNAADFYIETVTAAEVYEIKRSDMDTLMTKGYAYIEWAKKLAAEIYENKNGREKELLGYDGLTRLERFMNNNQQLYLTLTQTHIASYLNITPESFSALKRKLMQKSSQR